MSLTTCFMLPNRENVVLTFNMMFTLRNVWAESKLGYVHSADVNLSDIRPLVSRELLVREENGYTFTLFGLEVLADLDESWEGIVDLQFRSDPSDWGREQTGRSLDYLRSREVVHAMGKVRRLEAQLMEAQESVESLRQGPMFECDLDGIVGPVFNLELEED